MKDDGLIMMGDLPRERKKNDGLIMMGDLPRERKKMMVSL
jgi:hypothetical protein